MSAEAGLLAVTRFGLGPRPGEIAAVGGDPRAALLAMTERPEAALIRDAPVPDPHEELIACYDWKERRRELIVGGIDATTDEGRQQLRQTIGPRCFRSAYDREAAARAVHAVATDAPFVERLVQFWSNHFAISARKKNTLLVLAGDYERTAIRPHALGRFRDMLHAVAKHPAMIVYLDNQASAGPNSRLGRRRKRGLNENLAREILELHTLGVDGGYSQEDVTNFARILTGWSTTGRKDVRPLAFRFQERQHEPGAFTVLGRTIAEEGQAQGEAVLDMLASHPATARSVARRMARHFVAEDPPPALVERLAAVFRETDGNLAELARALVRSDEAWTPERVKLIPPSDFVVAALRLTGIEPRDDILDRAAQRLGQPVWMPPSPEGWPDEDAAWMLPDALLERVDWAWTLVKRAPADIDASSLAEAGLGPALDPHTRQMIARAESREQGLVLLLMSSQMQRR
jgi:uncharacterized protein (DUF1800 family)